MPANSYDFRSESVPASADVTSLTSDIVVVEVLRCTGARCVHITNFATVYLIFTDLISLELGGCEATQFVVAATN